MFLSNQAFEPGGGGGGGDSDEQGGLQCFQAGLCAGNKILALAPVGLGWLPCDVPTWGDQRVTQPRTSHKKDSAPHTHPTIPS